MSSCRVTLARACSDGIEELAPFRSGRAKHDAHTMKQEFCLTLKQFKFFLFYSKEIRSYHVCNFLKISARFSPYASKRLNSIHIITFR